MMKKILFTLIAFVAWMSAEAKVIRVTLADGTMQVFTTSQLSSIEFNGDGTLSIVTYDKKVIDLEFDEVVIDEQEIIYETMDYVLNFEADVDGTPINLHQERPAIRMNFVYPSTDPDGEPITLSGSILIPQNIWTHEKPCQGVILYNHYTIFNRTEAPTRGFDTLEGMLLANPLNPDYILVESDFYGFGVTERFPQAFLQGTANAHASIDALLAARRLLDEMGFDYGPLTFNVGYSSGGFDALAVQKCRDMEYSDQISFDKTFAGGSPSDVKECYRQYVQIDYSAYNAVPLLLMVSTNDTQHMNLDYEDVFQPEVAALIDEYVQSKNYSSWPVCDIVGRDKMIHEILADDYCDLMSAKSMELQNLFEQLSIATGWTPDPSQRLYIFHSRADDYVPVQAARPILSYLKENGFHPNIIPGATNLQTNFVVPKLGHLSATLVYLVQTVAALKAWPVMYKDGQLNPVYQAIVSEKPSPVEVMRYLDSMGFDCRALIKRVIDLLSEISEGGVTLPVDPSVIEGSVNQALAQLGLTTEDILEMSADSGLDITGSIMELVMYLAENPEEGDEILEPEGDEKITELGDGDEIIETEQGGDALKLRSVRQIPVVKYEQQLNKWLEAKINK